MRVPYVVAFGLVSAFAPGVIATDQPPLVVAGQTVVVPSGNLRLKAFLWKPNGPGPFPAVLFCHGSAGADAGHTGRAPADRSCRPTCTRVSETWLRIHVSILPRTRSFSRPSHVHTGHLAARGGVKGKRSSSALAVRPSYHRSARRCDGSYVIPQNCACSRCEVYCDLRSFLRRPINSPGCGARSYDSCCGNVCRCCWFLGAFARIARTAASCGRQCNQLRSC